MKSKQSLGVLILLLTSLIWGCAFVAQKTGLEYVEPFTFQTLRALLGVITLIPVILVRDAKNATYKKMDKKERNTLVLGGILCGLALTIASGLQQFGLQYSTAGKAGFITALYIILVPILGVFLKKKVRPVIWLCVAMAAVGLYLLCMTDSFTFGVGDIYLLLCSLCFAVHIMVVDHFSPRTDGVKLSCIQFATLAILSCIIMLIFENPTLPAIRDAWLSICYAGIMSCGVAYTLQIIGQKYAEPSVASLAMSFESVFAMLAGIIILGEGLTLRTGLGSLIMFFAILLSLAPERK